MNIEITSTEFTVYDDSACVDYKFMYNGKEGEFEVYIDAMDGDLGYILEFDGNACEWCVDEENEDNGFDPEFKEAFEKCFFIKIP